MTGTADTACDFSIQEGAAGGTVTPAGSYTPPAAAGTYHVIAKSHADPNVSATATALVIDSTQVGAWVNVTPSGLSLDFNYNSAGNYGVQDVVADPARPKDAYAFVCYQGVWRSQDYGVTWKKVSTGTNGAILDAGRPWTAAIDPNPARDPNTAPTLYTTNGYGPQAGLYKSTDFGVNWTYSKLTGPGYDEKYQDLYSLDIDPTNSAHIISGYHEDTAVAESFDSGATWTRHMTNFGISVYPFFVTGSSIPTTWIGIPQLNDGSESTQFTSNSGTSWSKIASLGHSHGTSQVFNAGGGLVYIAVKGGVFQTDGTKITNLRTTNENGITGTPSYLYTWDSGATNAPNNPALARAPRSTGKPWTEISAPSGMVNGPKRTAVTYDGTHYILVSGNWLAGIWRYVE